MGTRAQPTNRTNKRRPNLLRSGVEFVRGFLIALEFCDVSNVIHREGISGVEPIRFTKILFGSLNIVMVERGNSLEIQTRDPRFQVLARLQAAAHDL